MKIFVCCKKNGGGGGYISVKCKDLLPFTVGLLNEELVLTAWFPFKQKECNIFAKLWKMEKLCTIFHNLNIFTKTLDVIVGTNLVPKRLNNQLPRPDADLPND